MTKYTPVPLSFICVQPDDGKCHDAPPIVFLHGLTSFKSHWGDVPQEVANATKRKAYVIDARNHGDSEWCDEFNFDCNVEDLLHFMDYIGAKRATLVGHSMGGTTAIKTALRAPERVESIVVEDMSVKRLPQASCDILARYLRIISRAVQEVPSDVDESTAKNIIGKIFLDNSPYAKKSVKPVDHQGAYQLKRMSDSRFYHSFNAEVLIKAFDKKAEEVTSENTGEYCGPAAFIYGDKSPIQVGNDEEVIKRSFPNAVLMKIEEAGHEIHRDFSTEFKKSLVDFINTI
ncbi:hypothetical protein JTE90_011839 [Oedothorax gibbosus]|uniref:sn-1-specific diacylglycerol lipase ABHD11 n=1 Tax=Oedothorax gibbosus TaxID=931172 RepID=A0AAV6U1Y7_9ARAC|nr:hypothetical protein JTE90_011839 [Oedothorax gibbosus]